jgi:hypothetical protein
LISCGLGQDWISFIDWMEVKYLQVFVEERLWKTKAKKTKI